MIAHGVGVMVVQAEAAEEVLGANPDRAGVALRQIQDTGRQALTELRHMLGVLRGGAAEPPTAPRPAIADLTALVGRVSRADLDVRLAVEGDVRPLPEGFELSAYRIVQEGLTNIQKHAQATKAEVVVQYDRDRLEIVVTDNGVGDQRERDRSNGHGLIGMRERVAAYGGSLGITSSGRGFTVRVVLAPGNRRMIRVLLADDQTLVREGFRLILDLQDDIEVVGEAATGEEAVRLAHVRKPDVVLMDIRMPGIGGLEATRRLLAGSDPRPYRVLILTTFDTDEYVYEAMKAGASGFLLKDAPRRRLIDAIRVVAEGDAPLAPAITRRLIESFVRSPPPSAGVPDRLEALSTRELEVMGLVARGRSNAEIAGHLYLGEATVKTHVGRILTKLGLRDRAQIIVTAYETGLVRPGEEPHEHRSGRGGP